MLDIRFIIDNPEKVSEACTNKRVAVSVPELIATYKKRNELQESLDRTRSEAKAISREVQSAKTEKEKKAIVTKASELKKEVTSLTKSFEKVNQEFIDTMMLLPNIPTDDTPIGKDDSENVVTKKVGSPTSFSFEPQHHETIGVALNVLDKERAAVVSGSRFAYIKGELAMLEFALVQFVFSILTSEKTLKKIFSKAGVFAKPTPFIPVIPPVFIRTSVFSAMGRLEPKEDRYGFPEDDQYLVGSAEHTLGPLHMNQTLKEQELPIRYVGFSTCFRREAGTYGKDMKGLIRMHQFDKIEMESFTVKEEGEEEQKALVAIQEYLLSQMGLPYQVVSVCTGDMGKPDAKQVDLETWMPGLNKYVETHSADFMSDFQSRRLKIFVELTKGGKELVSMNDATAIACSRMFAAILENYQTKRGTVTIPKVLRPFMHGIKEIMHHNAP